MLLFTICRSFICNLLEDVNGSDFHSWFNIGFSIWHLLLGDLVIWDARENPRDKSLYRSFNSQCSLIFIVDFFWFLFFIGCWLISTFPKPYNIESFCLSFVFMHGFGNSYMISVLQMPSHELTRDLHDKGSAVNDQVISLDSLFHASLNFKTHKSRVKHERDVYHRDLEMSFEMRFNIWQTTSYFLKLKRQEISKHVEVVCDAWNDLWYASPSPFHL